MQDPVLLYPSTPGGKPRSIPAIDAPGWLNAGWSTEPASEPIPEPEPELPPPPPIEQKPAPKTTKTQPKAVEAEVPSQE